MARLFPIVTASTGLAPFQHVRFCLKYPTDCQPISGEAPLPDLDANLLALLREVNNQVNFAIAPRVKDFAQNIEERWTIDPSTGDCNDYAVTKRHMLLERGIPSNSLRLSVVRTPDDIGHLVLVVSTRSGDVVLDNLNSSIVPWHRTRYNWALIQSSANPRMWEKVVGNLAEARAIGQRRQTANRETP